MVQGRRIPMLVLGLVACVALCYDDGLSDEPEVKLSK